ncbi:sodium-dependent glucose transporter 1-like protein, partial [Dinothrombium tinctorium]
GMCYRIVSVTLNDLTRIANTTQSEFSYVLSARAGISLFSALLCGWIFNLLNRQVVLSFSMLLMGIGIFLTPHFPKLVFLLLNQSMVGFASSCIDTAANALILEMWNEKSNSYMQAVNLFFSLGTLVSPLIATPFVSSNASRTTNSNATNSTEGHKHITLIYSIVAGFTIIVFLIVLLFEILWPYKKPERFLSRKNQIIVEGDNESEPLIRIDLPRSYYITFVSLSCLLLSVYGGVEGNISNYLPTFLRNINENISQRENDYITSMYAFVFAGFRAISVFLAIKMKPFTMICISFSLLLFGNFLLLFFGMTTPTYLWISVCLLAIGCSWVYSCIYSFIEQRIDVTNAFSGLFVFSGSFLVTLSPLLIGKLIEKFP